MSVDSSTITVNAVHEVSKVAITVTLLYMPSVSSSSSGKQSVDASVTVTDSSGNPVPNAAVKIYGNTTELFSGTSNSSGKITGSLDFSSDGNYSVYAESEGSKSGSITVYIGAKLSIKSSDTSPYVNATFDITGTLEDSNGAGISNANISLTDKSTNTSSSSVTDSSGNYSFKVILSSAGAYTFYTKATP